MTAITNTDLFQVAHMAVRAYVESHPRPVMVTQEQAAEMLGVSHVTVRKMIRAGIIKLNLAGKIPIAEVDKVLSTHK